ncbi:hypothetical protein [Seleniivibrio woodruffii]|uniref:hypothetical protein n=1 Tax=Seleniivibrio woodruffii TaxID=1078050 RepID=UPI0026ED5280|nr:hypothetical protein [Seleniivibrio woodruffii]
MAENNHFKDNTFTRDPYSNEITQGTIFNNVYVNDFKNKETWGVIITARCDLAQAKSSIINFLPIVKLNDWLDIYGLRILKNEILNNNKDQIKNLLKETKIPTTLITTYSEEELINLYKTQCKPKKQNNLSELIKEKHMILKITDFCSLKTYYNKQVTPFMKRIFKNDVAGHYFLPSIFYNDFEGYIILLREIRHINADICKLFPTGFKIQSPDDDLIKKEIVKNSNEEIYPLAVINSPYIEHIMQSFALLFMRIGVDDLPDTYTNKLMGG